MGHVTFYTNPMSRGRIVRWMLEEIGGPYETVILPYGDHGVGGADFKAINPMSKVPTIVHDGETVTETAAICAYLADAFPEAGLAPPPAHRAAYYRWLFFAAGCVEPAVLMRALKLEISPEQARTAGFGTLARVMDALEGAVSGDGWIAGDTFSAADIYTGAQIIWGVQFGTLDERPAFTAYAERLTARPAYQRAAALDDEAAAAQQEPQ